MTTTDLALLDPTRASREHPVTAVVRLRAMRFALWMRRLWSREPESLHPAAIHHEEVDRVLADPAAAAETEARFYEQDPEASALSRDIDRATETLAVDERWNRLIRVFHLGTGEQQLLALTVAFACEPTIGRAFAYLHDQPEMTFATAWLAARLYGPSREAVTPAADAPLLKWRLVVGAPDLLPAQGTWPGWIADPAIVAWLREGGDRDVPTGATLTDVHVFEKCPVLYRSQLEAAREFLASTTASSVHVELVGAEGSGRRIVGAQLAAALQKPLLSVSEPQLLEGCAEADAPHLALATVRSARLHDAMLYWREARATPPAVRRVLLKTAPILVAGRHTAAADAPGASAAFRSIELPPLSRADRERLWRVFSDRPVPRQVRDWLLTPGELEHLARVERAGEAAIQQACRRPSDSLSLLVNVPLPFTPGDLVLPPALQRTVDDFESQVRFRWDVYEQWGFSRLCANGRGVIALFAGPSGTGKTMTAQVLARKLGLELYRLDPALVVNKYIGETEKRLKLIFDECDRAHFMLLIDECEGMFGQRFASKDAHDRYANLEIDYLLQRLERFQGIAVLATNRKGDLDAAFQRRIRFVIDFLPPGPAERLRLWQKALPSRSPAGEEIVEALDFNALAERVALTGAEIALAAVNAAFLARAADSRIAMSHVLEAVRRELAKKGQNLRGFE